MKTILHKVREDDDKYILEAADIIRNSGLVAFPTETVYGLGANALLPDAAKKIYFAKGRPSDNPLIVHISRFNDIYNLTDELPRYLEELADKFWPGPLTIIVKKSELVPFDTTGGLDSVAIRMPQSLIARKLIEYSGVPIAAPSANTSGRPSPTSARHVLEDLDGRIDMILDGGEVGIGLESTIIDLTDVPTILRPGAITREMLLDVCDEIFVDKTTLSVEENLRPRAPGMKYRHYAPRAKMEIVIAKGEALFNGICDRVDKRRTVILATDGNAEKFSDKFNENPEVIVKSLGDGENLDDIAHNLFDRLRLCDELGAEHIICEGFSESGIGVAIMNRLRKAAAFNIVDLR